MVANGRFCLGFLSVLVPPILELITGFIRPFLSDGIHYRCKLGILRNAMKDEATSGVKKYDFKVLTCLWRPYVRAVCGIPQATAGIRLDMWWRKT